MSATLKLRRAPGSKTAELADEFRRLAQLRNDVMHLADGAGKESRGPYLIGKFDEDGAMEVYDECNRQMLGIAEKYFALTEHSKAS
jgi:hypothetical protein